MVKTFAQYLIDKRLPAGMEINKQVDKNYLNSLLAEVGRKYPAQYDKVVMALKRLGDVCSTYEATTMGLDEISVPNKTNRDAIIKKYQGLIRNEKNPDKVNKYLTELQTSLAQNDMTDTKDDASTMIRSAMGGKKLQLMKLRTSPGVVGDTSGKIIPVIFPKSYAEGMDPLQYWLGASDAKAKIAEGRVNTAKPGEWQKVLANVMGGAVVSTKDCGTDQGILLFTKDDDVLDRYLARDEGSYKKGTLVTPDVQQDLLKSNKQQILVRSPETCRAKDQTVCQMCMGLRPGTGKNYEIGDNAGLITSGNIGEPLQQMTLSAKHSTTMAGVQEGLRGETGFRKLIESPEIYNNRKILCEVVGEVFRIKPAPQGGKIVTIRQTKPVPERYIVTANKVEGMKGYWDYHIPPNLKLVEGLKAGSIVYPGMELSTGIDNLRDIARLRNLGFMRSAAAQGMYDIYKNTGLKLDRRHFELVAKSAHRYVKIVKAPRNSDLLPGDTIPYQELEDKASKLPQKKVVLNNALGKVLGEGVLDVTVGTEIDERVRQYLEKGGVKDVSVVDGLEVEAVMTPMTRVVNKASDWIAALNHRNLKDQIISAVSIGKKTDIHSYNPFSAYAYGVEMGHGENGRY